MQNQAPVTNIKQKPKIATGWKVALPVLVVIDALVYLPLLLFYGSSPQTDADAVGAIWVFMLVVGPLSLLALPLALVTIVTVFGFLFYLLGRERKYGKG